MCVCVCVHARVRVCVFVGVGEWVSVGVLVGGCARMCVDVCMCVFPSLHHLHLFMNS